MKFNINTIAKTVSCPGHHKMTKSKPKHVKNLEAVAARELAYIAVQNDGLWLRETFPMPDGNEIVVTDEMLYISTMFLSLCRSICKPCGATGIKIDLEGYETPVSGRCDYYKFVDDVLHVVSLNVGHRESDESMSAQKLFALALVEQRIDMEINSIHLYSCQPLVYSNPVFLEKMTPEELEVDCNSIFDAIQIAMTDDATVHSGPHCYRCTALFGCPANSKAAEAIIDIAALPIAIPTDEHRLAIELNLIRRAIAILKNRMIVLEATGMAMISAGVRVPGHVVKNRRPTVKWAEDKSKVLALGKKYEIDLSKNNVCTPKQAIKLGVPKEAVDAVSIVEPGEKKLTPDKTTLYEIITGGKL